MIEKTTGINNSEHPYSEKINNTITSLNMIFDFLSIFFGIFGFIVALIASTGLAEEMSDHNSVFRFPVHFFGYVIELESNTLSGSPLTVFIYIITIFALISLAIFCIKTITVAILNAKAKMLNSLYHCEKMTELLVENYCHPQAETHSSESCNTSETDTAK